MNTNKEHYLTPISEEGIQVILTGVLGDGRIDLNGIHCYYRSNCIHKEYLEFKRSFISNISTEIKEKINGGFKKSTIYSFSTKNHPDITKIGLSSLEDNLKRLTELGIALWIYDDGSFHQKKHFYNINTQAFSEQEHDDLLIPFLHSRDIKATKRIERKKDGRVFYYCSINKRDGSDVIMRLLNKYPIECYKYKTISSETIESIFLPKQKLKEMTQEKMRNFIKDTSRVGISDSEKQGNGLINFNSLKI